MKSNAPWSVKGIERDAREAAKEAARREGMTVGEWLNQMIYSHGQEQTSTGGEVEGLKLRDIVTAIEHIRNRIVEAEKKSNESVSALSRNVGGVVERVQRLERVKPQEGSYEDLAARLEKLESAGGDRNRIEALKALEKAVAQVATQFSSAQKTTLHRLDSAEQQLQEFAERIDRVGLDGEPADVESLKTTIEGLAERVARAEKVAGEAAALKDAAAASADPDFVEQTGAKLRVLGDEIKRGGDQIRAFEGAIAKLSEQIEAAEKRSAEGVQKVAETVAEVREQVLAESKGGDAASELEARLAAAREETEERLSALQRSFNELNERMKKLNATATPPSPAPTPDTQSAQAAADREARPDEEAASAVDDIEEAVAALEADADSEDADSEKDPFAFADDDLEAEADSEDGEEALEDFSFQLDDDEDAEEPETTDAADNDVGDAQSRLAKVRSALSDEGFSRSAEEERAADADDDIDAILGNLEDDAASLGDEDDEDEQAPGTASLTPASDVDAENDDDADEAGAAETAETSNAPQAEEAQETSPDDDEDTETEESYPASARRRAKEAAAGQAEDAKRPTRRNLTAKQRAILAARARQKQLKARASEDPRDDDEDAFEAKPAATPRNVDADERDLEDATPRGRFAKIAGALSAARSRLARRNEEKEERIAPVATEAARHESDALKIGRDDDAYGRNGDRAALETLKATSSARPVTLALGVAIILAVAALAFLVKDFIFSPSDDAQSTPAVSRPAEAPAESTPEAAAGERTAGESESDLPTVPEAPAVDPEALYREAMSDLDAAGDEAAAIGAVEKLQDAAALGFPPAQLQLGELYKTGQGVEQDLGQARVWFRRAANGGNVLAMHRIGVMTARGDGGPADTQGAIAWFEQAANFGLVDSQYNLGAIYHPSDNGAAVQDAEKAYYWYSLAARNGDEAAGPLAAGVGADLSADERAAVDEQVAGWVAEDADPAANAMSQG